MDKVLYAASSFGHLRSFHIPYLRALLDRGDEVWALASGDPAGLPDGLRTVRVPFTKSMTSAHNVEAAGEVARLVRRERFDLVVTHTSLAAFFVRLGICQAGKRDAAVVNVVHGYLFDERTSRPRRTVMLGAEQLMARVTDRIVTMNRQDTEIARRHRLCRGDVVQVDGMGADLTGCRQADERGRREAREALGLPEDAFVLLYAGEFSARKNQSALIEALPELPKDVVLALPGRGERFEACRDCVAELGLEGRVAMPGFASDLTAWRAASDACVSSSRSEGLPFHVIEGMACGLPVILTDVKGHEDLVVEGASAGTAPGLLYPFGDAGAFQRCVLRLHGDRSLARRMGDAACEIAQRYSLGRVMPSVLDAMLLA
ncbi:MAG: glycosyltransferase [Coriobacteriia bacterium]|nr:glycosyltransferase [Coriobacteriia bacterium]MBS5478765.1 glycosyltransferase [Coriobacteriia bacterium]